MYTEQLTQGLALAAAPVAPQTLNGSGTASGSTGGIDMQKFRRALFLVFTGSVAGGGSLSVKLQESSDNSSGWSDISGAALTAITAATKIASLELRADQMTKRYVRALLTETGNQNVVCASLALGGVAVQKPGNSQDVAAVVQRLVL